MAYKSLDSIVQYCAEHGAAFDEAVLEDDMQERDVTRDCLLYTSDAADD